MIIALISGFSKSGKDTAGQVFQNMGFKRYSFAEALKKYTSELYGFPLSLTVSQEGKSTIVHNGSTVRTLLIKESLKMKQVKQNDGYWADIIIERIKSENPKYIVITDWRYVAEYEHFRNSFDRDEIVKINIVRTGLEQSEDPSEHDLDRHNFDHILLNNSDRKTFTKKTMELITGLFS